MKFDENQNILPAKLWKQYDAGEHDLVLDGGAPARLIVCLGSGDFTACENPEGDDAPLTGLFQGYEHRGRTSYVECTMGIVVYW